MKLTLAELVTVLSYQLDEDALKKHEAALKNIQGRANQVAGTLATVGTALTAAITLPFLAFSALAVKSASDAENAGDRFGQVFEKFPNEAAASVNRLANSYDIAHTKAMDLVSSTSSFLRNFGIGERESIAITERIGRISAELASFKELEGGAAEAAAIVRRALGGQTRGLLQLGIVVKEEQIKQKIATEAARGHTYATQQQAEAMAVLGIITERTAKLEGYYAKNRGDFDNQLRIFHERVTSVAEAFGAILLPIATKGVKIMNNFLDALEKTSPGFKKMLLVIGGTLAVVGPVLLALAALVGLIGMTAAGVGALVIGLGALEIELLPVIGVFLLWAAGIALVFFALQDLYTFMTGGDSLIGRFFEKLTNWGTKLNDVLTPIAKKMSDIAASANAKMQPYISSINSGAAGFSDYTNRLLGQGQYRPQIASKSGGSVAQSNSVKIEVDARGNSPTETAEAVRSGVETGFGDVIRQTKQNFTSGVKY